MGAGLIPFCFDSGQTRFLLHKTFTGRRAGKLVDFGGGTEPGESYLDTAVREFLEETDGMFFAGDLSVDLKAAKHLEEQHLLLRKLIRETQRRHPHWWCSRLGKAGRLKSWRTFFVQVEHRPLTSINQAWERDEGRRFRKRRELLWVEAPQLILLLRQSPEQLWERLLQLQDLEGVVKSIARQFDGR